MKKKIFISFLIIILVALSYGAFTFVSYIYAQKINENMVEYCSQNNSDDCYKRMFERLLPRLLIHNVKKDGKELSLSKVDKSPTWVPFLAYSEADAFIRFFDFSLHFPIGHNFYETKLREKYGFPTIEIAYWTDTDKGDAYSTLFQILEDYKKKNKKLFLKIDVSSLNEDFVKKLIEYNDILTGILFYVHIEKTSDVVLIRNILDILDETFVLTSRNSDYGDGDTLFINTRNIYKLKKEVSSKYYDGFLYNNTLILSLINKKLIDSTSLYLSQNTDVLYTGEKVKGHRAIYKTPKSDIHWAVTIMEIIKYLFKKVQNLISDKICARR